jgi:DNA sulfur modification protein DndB
MEEQIEVFKSNLIRNHGITTDLKTRNRSYDQLTINKLLLPEYESSGWSKVKENKNTFVIRTPKPHDRAFEDRVWTCLAKMGFEEMNGSSSLKLVYLASTNVPGRKLDVYAADKETVIVVECKSAEQLKKKNFQTVINDFITVKNGSAPFLQKLYQGEKRKVKFILATHNIILSPNDKERLKSANIEHFKQDDIDYYEQLIERLGQASKYQLLGRLFKNQEIPQLANRVPAIQGKMGGYTYYSFSLEPEKLLKIGYILHRTEINTEDEGYQRMVSKSRLKEIEQFLDSEDEDEQGFFPNSIIINISTTKEAPLNFDRLTCTHDSDITEPVILHLPKKYHSAFIIDGQHRLYGYANSKWKFKNSIPVVAFENLPPDKQVELFVQINSKQKPVPKTVLIPIAAALMWNSDKPKDAISSLKAKLVQGLGEEDNSPLYRRIVLNENPKSEITCITQDYIISYGFNKSNYFPRYQKNNIVSLGHLFVDPKDEGYDKMLRKCSHYFTLIFNYVEEKLNFQWRIGNGEGGLISTNIGVVIIIRITDNIIDHLIDKSKLNPISSSSGELAAQVYKYLDFVISYISTLDHQKIKQFKSMGTSAGGIENLIREIQKIVNEKSNDFNPKGLDQWLRDNSGEFNEDCKSLTEKLEYSIRENVFMKLKDAFGDRWWIDGVSKEIRKKASNIAIEKDNEEPDWNFLFLLDYKKIVESNWLLFKDVYADPEFKSGKDNQVRWFDQLNEIRNKVSHPGRARVTETESLFIRRLDEWLYELIQNED